MFKAQWKCVPESGFLWQFATRGLVPFYSTWSGSCIVNKPIRCIYIICLLFKFGPVNYSLKFFTSQATALSSSHQTVLQLRAKV